MPEMDGLEATRRLRAGPSPTPIRIVAMTANAMAEDREACFAAGMDDYVSKPIRVGELTAALVRTSEAVANGTAPQPDRSERRPVPDEPKRPGPGDPRIADGQHRRRRRVHGRADRHVLADAPEQLEALNASLAAGDVAGLVRPAHTLKSASASLGALGLAELCRQLELAAKAGSLEGAAESIEGIAAELERVVTALEHTKRAFAA